MAVPAANLGVASPARLLAIPRTAELYHQNPALEDVLFTGRDSPPFNHLMVFYQIPRTYGWRDASPSLYAHLPGYDNATVSSSTSFRPGHYSHHYHFSHFLSLLYISIKDLFHPPRHNSKCLQIA